MLSVQLDDVKRLKAVVGAGSSPGTVMPEEDVRVSVADAPVIETDRGTPGDPYTSALPDAVGD